MNSTQDFFILLQANITFIMMKKQYVKAETEIVPMKTESLMGVTGSVEDFKPGEGDPDPGRGARAHNDDDDMEYSFELTPPSTEEE
jgi:hypothetical protein